jgi:hypothetical protein
MAWNSYTFAAPINVAPGEVYGVELTVIGSGTHSVAGQATWLPNHPTVYPKNLAAVRNSGTSAPPATIASASVVYSTNVPFIELGISASGVGADHHEDETIQFVGDDSIPIPSWATEVDVIALGGGGGGGGGILLGLDGNGGEAGKWATTVWQRGTHFTGSASIAFTIGVGGAPGTGGPISSTNGAAGTDTVISIPGYSLTAPHGAGSAASTHLSGYGPGNTTFNTAVYSGGGQQDTVGGPGATPGGAGAGGGGLFGGNGGAGAGGTVFFVMRQTAPINTSGSITPAGLLSSEAFGTPTIVLGAAQLRPTGIPSGEAFGTLSLNPVVFESVGAGNSTSTGNPTWTHTINGNMLMVGVTTGLASGVTATVGSTSMVAVGTPINIGVFPDTYCWVFKLQNPPQGSQTITANIGASNANAANSVSYKGVATVGRPVTASGHSNSPTVSTPSAAGQMVFNLITNNMTDAAFASYNQTQRSYSHVSGQSPPTLIGDAPGAPTVTFTATNSSSQDWAAVAVPLIP